MSHQDAGVKGITGLRSYFEKTVDLAKKINQKIQLVVDQYAGKGTFDHNKLKNGLQNALSEGRSTVIIYMHCAEFPIKLDDINSSNFTLIESIDICFDKRLNYANCTFTTQQAELALRSKDTTSCFQKKSYRLPLVATLYKPSENPNLNVNIDSEISDPRQH